MNEPCVCSPHETGLVVLFKDAVGNLAVLMAVNVAFASGLFRKRLIVMAKQGVKFVASGHKPS